MAGKPGIWVPERMAWLKATISQQITSTGRVDFASICAELAKVGVHTTPEGVKNAHQRLVTRGQAVGINAQIAAAKTRGLVTIDATPAPMAATPEPLDPVQVEQDRKERIRAYREEREELQAIAGEKSFRTLLEKIARETAPVLPAPPRYVPPRATRGTSQETIVQMLSDLHGGERVSREGTRGFNEFSTAILAERLKAVIDAHLSIKARMERGDGWAFRKLVVALNGDLVSGTIHEIERHSDTRNVVWAVYAVAHLVAQAIRDLSAQYAEVEVFCTSGNHGRLPDARRIQQKDPTRSWDTFVALLARAELAGCRHVRWYIPDAYSVAYDVEGWAFCQTHGHDVKSWNSIPWYGLNRLVSNINALEASRGKTIHYWLFGHFHSASSLPHPSGESFINGSLIGGTEFTVNGLGKADQPRQWMLGVQAEHGVTFRFPLNGLGGQDAYHLPAEAMAA